MTMSKIKCVSCRTKRDKLKYSKNSHNKYKSTCDFCLDKYRKYYEKKKEEEEKLLCIRNPNKSRCPGCLLFKEKTEFSKKKKTGEYKRTCDYCLARVTAYNKKYVFDNTKCGLCNKNYKDWTTFTIHVTSHYSDIM